MTPADLYGPWDVAGYQVTIDPSNGVRLVASREGSRLRNLPAAVRQSEELAWIDVALEAAKQHHRDTRKLLENAMVEEIPLTSHDLALLALDPVGRALIEGLLLNLDGLIGRPVLDEWALETASGDWMELAAPAVVVHPIRLESQGSLERWNRWLNRTPVRQPFKQIRREVYYPNTQDRACGTFSDRFAGETVRWDQSRALLEGRGWYRVTKSAAEKNYARAALTAHLEFRTPAGRSFSKEDVVLSRVFFLPGGETVVNKARPGLPLETVPPLIFSETLRDTGLVAAVAGRETPGYSP